MDLFPPSHTNGQPQPGSSPNTSDLAVAVTVCPDCSLILQAITPLPHQVAVCPRCAQQLYRHRRNTVQKALVLSLTGLFLYMPANVLPLLSFSVLGFNTHSSIVQACLSLFQHHQYVLGITVVLTTLVFPFLVLAGLLLISLGLSRQWQAPWMPRFFRLYHHLSEWAMIDVFLVGVLITMIKMSHMATLSLNAGFFCFVGLVITTLAAQAVTDHQHFWALMDDPSARQGDQGNAAPMAAAERPDADTLVLCHSCHKLLPADAGGAADPSGPNRCPRCGHSLRPRKKNSIARTWALLLTACLLTLPANLLPIMEVDSFGVPDRSTIMDGILYFFREGSYGIGLVILIASILVPLFKIIGLGIILLSIHFHWHSWLRHKAIMFRTIEFIGRWSMLDIFVITLLCALAQFGFLSSINAAPAAFYFTGVVLSTMFAALSFDPRLLWDAASVAPDHQ